MPARLSAAAVAGHGAALEPCFQMPPFSLTEMEKDAIVRALEYTKGDRVMAAQLLGIGRTTLYRKLKEYRLAG